MNDTTTVVRLILASGRVLSAADHVKPAYNTEESFIQLHNDLGYILYSFNRFLDDLYSSAGSGPLQQWFANKYPQGCLDALAEMEARISGIDSTTGTVNEIHSTVEYFDQHRALFQALLDTRESPKKSNVAPILTEDGTSAHPNESQEFEVPSTREGSLSDFGTSPNEPLVNPDNSADPQRQPDTSVGQSDDNGLHHSAEGPGTPPHEQPAGPNNKTGADTRQQNTRPLSDQIRKFLRGFLQPQKSSIPPAHPRCDDPLQTEMASLSNRPEPVVGARLDDFTRGDEQPVPDNETPSISSLGATQTNLPLQADANNSVTETPTSHPSWSWSDLLCFRKRAERVDELQNHPRREV
ncbi:hypothetical protein JVT61DRAFT_8906 [Boletus reticuloceps]|uniref:Uncharacterized protein n=1 Tax=Boletus reticuloceps TaxID=495285 RepID=A0A8I3A6Z6_9AGAM|nr:hypothetical protein JVT61DRAFT_8906 [Boletus reticuloceps]